MALDHEVEVLHRAAQMLVMVREIDEWEIVGKGKTPRYLAVDRRGVHIFLSVE